MSIPNTTLAKLDFVIKQLGGTPGTGGRIGQYEYLAVPLSGVDVSLSGTALALSIFNIHDTNSGQVSFDNGVSWTTLPNNFGGINLSTDAGLKVEITNLKLKSLVAPASFQILTIEST